MNPHPQAAQLRLVYDAAQARRFETEPVRSWLVTVTNSKGSMSYSATGTRSEVWDAAIDSWGCEARISIRPLEAA